MPQIVYALTNFPHYRSIEISFARYRYELVAMWKIIKNENKIRLFIVHVQMKP